MVFIHQDLHFWPPILVFHVYYKIILMYRSTSYRFFWDSVFNDTLGYIYTREPINPRPMPTKLLWLGLVWSGKRLSALNEERIYPDQHPLYPRCIPDVPTLKSHSSRPIPVLLADQSVHCTTNPRPIPDTTTLTTLSIGLTPDLNAWFPLPASNEQFKQM